MITLLDCQVDHVKKLVRSTSSYYIGIDTSKTGLGKTYCACKITQENNTPNIVVISSLSTKNVWNDMKEGYDIPIKYMITYQKLRGVKDSQPNHNLLTREVLNGKSNFKVTSEFLSLIEEGCALILDEVHFVANDNDQRKAVRALCRAINIRNKMTPKPANFSYIIAISATHVDSKIKCINLISTLGLTESDTLDFNCDFTKCKKNFDEVFNVACSINSHETHKIKNRETLSKKNIMEVAYKIVNEIILPETSSNIQKDETSEISQSVYLGYFSMPEEGYEMIQQGIDIIHYSSKNHEDDENLTDEDIDVHTEAENVKVEKGVTSGMIKIQLAKAIHTVVPQAIRAMSEIPNCKILAFFNYKKPIRATKDLLSEYNVAVITGDTKLDERASIIAKFQEPNLDIRVLILNTCVGAEAISLDDQHGNYPRITFAVPDFRADKAIQIAGRSNRQKTQSNSLVIWTFSDKVDENSVWNCVERKSNVMKNTIKDNKRLYPEEYIKIKEEEITNYLDLLNRKIKIEAKEKHPKIKVIRPDTERIITF